MVKRLAPSVIGLGIALGIALGGGGISVSELRTGFPHGSLPPDCALELTTLSPLDMAPGHRFGDGGQYEMVGAVMVAADGDAFSEQVKAVVRPRACAMGGKVVTLTASGTAVTGFGQPYHQLAFQVWAERSQAPASALTIPY